MSDTDKPTSDIIIIEVAKLIKYLHDRKLSIVEGLSVLNSTFATILADAKATDMNQSLEELKELLRQNFELLSSEIIETIRERREQNEKQ
jgi:hypothetical protein